MESDLLYKIAISLIPKVGPVTAKALIAYVGSIEGVFKESLPALRKIPGISEQLAKQIANKSNLEAAEKEIAFIERYKIDAIFYTEKNYPERLRLCNDSPLIIYKKGNGSLIHENVISIIGTRNASSYGTIFCEKLIGELAELGYSPVIVSGLAYGIDICAHKAALKYKLPTVAVLAHGLSQIYPTAHKKVAEEMLENGALITEFRHDTKAFRGNFISRNRIVAGFSEATIVIESAEKGGALITAEMANGYSREVFALPGRITDKYSQGCNQLIQQHKAQILCSATNIVEALNWDMKPKKAVQRKLFVKLSKEESMLVESMKNGESTIDELARATSLTISKISSSLLTLEFQGLVKCLPGKKYTLI